MDQTPKKDILVVQEDRNVGRGAYADLGEICGPYCNAETNDICLRLIEFATYYNIGTNNPLRRWTWHSPDSSIIFRLNTLCRGSDSD